MKYFMYFHDDLDGTTCGALLLHFFKSRGDDIDEFHPLDYSANTNQVWPDYAFRKPFIIVDFIYHPEADWWFDHHISGFIKQEWRKNFRNNGQHYFDPAYKSCFGMLINFLEREYGYKPTEQLRSFEAEVDKIDSASFESAREVLTIKSFPQKLAFLIDSYEEGDAARSVFQIEAMRELAFGDIKEFLSRPQYKKRLNVMEKDIEESFKNYKKIVVIKRNVSFLDVANSNLKIRYAPFVGRAIFPDLEYALSIKKQGDHYHISVSRNKWLKTEPQSDINIGELSEKYGGGGHKDISGIEISTYEEALKICAEIVEYLNKHE